MATETDVWADVYGHPVKVGTATAADENGARIVKISEEFDEAPFTNLRFQDDVDAAANAPAVEEPVGVVEAPVVEFTPEVDQPKPEVPAEGIPVEVVEDPKVEEQTEVPVEEAPAPTGRSKKN